MAMAFSQAGVSPLVTVAWATLARDLTRTPCTSGRARSGELPELRLPREERLLRLLLDLLDDEGLLGERVGAFLVGEPDLPGERVGAFFVGEPDLPGDRVGGLDGERVGAPLCPGWPDGGRCGDPLRWPG